MGEPNTYVFYSDVAKAGCWVISDTWHIYVKTKPNWFNKKMMKIILGWGWKDGGYK